MRLFPISALLLAGLLSLQTHASNLEDVVYKKDGSVLRGTLIEQDFENGRYKIQLEGGSVFAIDKADIEKITKEAPLNPVSQSNGININIDNSPSIQQNPNQTLEQSPAITNYAGLAADNDDFENVIYIGSMGKSITDDNEDGWAYSGFNVAIQRNFTEHHGAYLALNSGKISEIIRDGERYEIPSFIDSEERVTQLQLAGLLSTNLYRGWQFYTGAGLFVERYSEPTNDTVSGFNVLLGMGYSWKTIQLQLRVSADISDDYGDDYSGSTANLQLGFNY